MFTDISNENCFNFGGSHSLNNCRKPQNKERIKANKNIFNGKNYKLKSKSDAKKGSDHQKNGKWYSPTNAENKNYGHCNIHGKKYY